MNFTARLCSMVVRNSLSKQIPEHVRNFCIMSRPITVNKIFDFHSTPGRLFLTSGMQPFLKPLLTIIIHVAGFKVRRIVKRRCKDCYIVIRHQRAYVICPTHPRHKQMSMKKAEKSTLILTHATQSKERPY